MGSKDLLHGMTKAPAGEGADERTAPRKAMASKENRIVTESGRQPTVKVVEN